MILAADIGGTKSLFAFLEVQEDKWGIILEKKYSSKDFSSLEELLQLFLTETFNSQEILPIKSACFSLAGPIQEGTCKLVNLNWTVKLENIKKVLPTVPKVELCNDLAAVAHGISLLAAKDFLCLTPELHSQIDHAKSMNSLLNKAVIAPGTGLGESMILAGQVHPSEGAHCDFAPQTEKEVRLWRFLHKNYGHVSYERLLSGPGLKNIYDFLLEDTIHPAEKANSLPHQTPPDLKPEDISNKALKNSCPLCRRALDIFVRVLGAEAGNLALKTLPLGGVYLGGGIPPQILPALQSATFLESFRAKGRFAKFMEQIPVYVILNAKTALYGAALLAARKLSPESQGHQSNYST
jgi:glucokinase